MRDEDGSVAKTDQFGRRTTRFNTGLCLYSGMTRFCSNNPACRTESRNAGEGGRRAILWAFRAESAHEIHDQA